MIVAPPVYSAGPGRVEEVGSQTNVRVTVTPLSPLVAVVEPEDFGLSSEVPVALGKLTSSHCVPDDLSEV